MSPLCQICRQHREVGSWGECEFGFHEEFDRKVRIDSLFLPAMVSTWKEKWLSLGRRKTFFCESCIRAKINKPVLLPLAAGLATLSLSIWAVLLRPRIELLGWAVMALLILGIFMIGYAINSCYQRLEFRNPRTRILEINSLTCDCLKRELEEIYESHKPAADQTSAFGWIFLVKPCSPTADEIARSRNPSGAP
jgi:hypothetical protein